MNDNDNQAKKRRAPLSSSPYSTISGMVGPFGSLAELVKNSITSASRHTKLLY
jgi:hypothetical protein